MKKEILGLHHITAIAGDAQRNYDFYTKTLGFRLVKKTVNFDDPQTYHFFFGDEVGTPGTIITFFPWTNVRQGKNGAGWRLKSAIRYHKAAWISGKHALKSLMYLTIPLVNVLGKNTSLFKTLTD